MTGEQNAPGGSRPRSAVFVDRDGTLNPDLHYLADANRLEVFRGVPLGIRLLNQRGFVVVCVTNQSGIERGLYTAADVERIHARLSAKLALQSARIDAFYYCPHVPEHGCACRKPGTELFERAVDELHLELSSSAMIGDRVLDVEAGDRLGLLTAAVGRLGHAEALEAELRSHRIQPDIRSDTFLGAVRRVLTRG